MFDDIDKAQVQTRKLDEELENENMMMEVDKKWTKYHKLKNKGY